MKKEQKDHIKEKLHKLAINGGDDALLPQVLLELVESAEESNTRIGVLEKQISENAQETEHQISALGESAKKTADGALQKQDTGFAALRKKLSWNIGIVAVIALVLSGFVVWSIWRYVQS